MKNLKNMVLLSAAFAFGICGAVEQDFVEQDSTEQVTKVTSDSPLHKLLIMRSGQGIFFASWPAVADQENNAKNIEEFIETSFDGLAKELAEDAAIVADIGHVVKKYAAILFKYAGAVQFLSAKVDFSAGNDAVSSLLENQIKAAGLSVDVTEIVAQVSGLVGDVVALLMCARALGF